MRALLVLILVAVSISMAEAAACYHSGYYTSCGIWGWSRCFRKRYTFCVHGGWSTWKESSHTACSKTCERGTRIRTDIRSCTNPPPFGHGAKTCSGRGWKTFQEICNVNPCYVHGGWSAWSVSTSTECSVTCGVGLQKLNETRSCSNPRPFGREGRNCSGITWRTRDGCCRGDACPNWLNSTCEADTDCPAADSLCVEGKCLCVHSYYYSWSGDSCIPECSEEDRQRIFLLYPSMYNKAKPQNDITNTTLEECLETCRDRPNCHFINFNKSRGNCFSSESLMSNLQTNNRLDFYRATCA